MVERSAHNRLVVGSIHAGPTTAMKNQIFVKLLALAAWPRLRTHCLALVSHSR